MGCFSVVACLRTEQVRRKNCIITIKTHVSGLEQLLLLYYSWNGGRAEAVCAGENELPTGKEFLRVEDLVYFRTCINGGDEDENDEGVEDRDDG